MVSRQPGLRWLIALLVIIGLAFALEGDWLWTFFAAALLAAIVARDRRAKAEAEAAADADADEPDPHG
ncbi:MAG TPA: hypothetical protein VGM33_12935 [Baekduia sp.]|jgi:hypothetical protein